MLERLALLKPFVNDFLWRHDFIKKNPYNVTMSTQNYTSVQRIIDEYEKKKKQPQSVSYSKEGEPIKISSDKVASQEIELTDSEPKIEDKEVEKFVEVQKDEPSIHPDLKKAGLQALSGDSIDPKAKMKLPLSDDKILYGLHQPVTSSIRWLAEMALFMLKHAHLTLKKIHGHVVRVMSR